jgi:hypothetical protein
MGKNAHPARRFGSIVLAGAALIYDGVVDQIAATLLVGVAS